ncbi:MAG: hypothetical protein AB7P16_27645 [Bradyrhizobium sp.]|uniref:hypothetical protein n=1 Tax=Bradyrhizobium sp. TaxID=376 RepID=UPI003D0FBC06
MDRVRRHYAHSAWTPADPLAGLEPDVRRAILLMPSTFRERWRLAPWTSRDERRLAVAEIMAERKLLYELTSSGLERTQPGPAPPAPSAAAPVAVTSPYYRYRMRLHQETLAAMHDGRRLQDRDDLEKMPEARQDHERRQATRKALRDIELERARLDIKELQILDGDVPQKESEPRSTRSPARQRRRRRDRER